MRTIINAKAVALMAAGNFMSGFNTDDMRSEKFNTQFDSEFGEIDYSVFFDKKGNAIKMEAEVWLPNGNYAELSGNYKEAMNTGVSIINDLMSVYDVIEIREEEPADRYDLNKDEIFDRFKIFQPTPIYPL